jgi:hypothetical protein
MFKININYSPTYVLIPKVESSVYAFPPKNLNAFLSLVRATCLAHILLHVH